jgi:hypothetical protein
MLFVYLQMFFICKIHIKCDHSLLALVEGFNDYPNIDFDKIYSSLFEIIDKLFNIMFVILL